HRPTPCAGSFPRAARAQPSARCAVSAVRADPSFVRPGARRDFFAIGLAATREGIKLRNTGKSNRTARAPDFRRGICKITNPLQTGTEKAAVDRKHDVFRHLRGEKRKYQPGWNARQSKRQVITDAGAVLLWQVAGRRSLVVPAVHAFGFYDLIPGTNQTKAKTLLLPSVTAGKLGIAAEFLHRRQPQNVAATDEHCHSGLRSPCRLVGPIR